MCINMIIGVRRLQYLTIKRCSAVATLSARACVEDYGGGVRAYRMEEIVTEKTFRPGDRVTWKSHGGEAHGTIVRKQTSRTHIKGHEVAASKNNPEFIVETHNGKRAAHKPAALKRD